MKYASMRLYQARGACFNHRVPFLAYKPFAHFLFAHNHKAAQQKFLDSTLHVRMLISHLTDKWTTIFELQVQLPTELFPYAPQVQKPQYNLLHVAVCSPSPQVKLYAFLLLHFHQTQSCKPTLLQLFFLPQVNLSIPMCHFSLSLPFLHPQLFSISHF